MEKEFASLDGKGRIVIPVEFREEFHTDRFVIKRHGNELILKPVKRPEQLFGIAKGKKLPKFKHFGKEHKFLL